MRFAWAGFFIAHEDRKTLLTNLRVTLAQQQNLPTRGICAHRGASHTHLENTLAAIDEAVRLGAQQVDAVIVLIFFTSLAGPLLTRFAGQRLVDEEPLDQETEE